MSGGSDNLRAYLALRAVSAAGTLLAGVSQTYVFARILDAHRFSLFIVIGNLGQALWLFDLGIAKVLYLHLRSAFLAGRTSDTPLPLQATAVLLVYGGLVAAGSAACLVLGLPDPAGGPADRIELALYFSYTALNLVWFVLRNLSSATDQFLFFEALEVARRVGHLVLVFCLLAQLPVLAFLVLGNLLWAILLALIARSLLRRGILGGNPAGLARALHGFFRTHRRQLLASGGHAAGEIYIYNLPSLVVPTVHGLGAPTIIFDTVFKIFRGATVVFAAGCDLVVPRQTRAYAAGDHAALGRATRLALALGAVPAVGLCGLMLAADDAVYRLLLGTVAAIPSCFTPVLLALVVCSLIQTVSNYLLVHTGFFASIARLAGLTAMAMTVAAAFDAAWSADLQQFAWLYAAAYGLGAAGYAALALRHPLRGRPGSVRTPSSRPAPTGTGEV